MSRGCWYLVACLVYAVACGTVRADDVGLVNARLTEREANTYVIDLDVPPRMVGLLGAPILPERFTGDAKPEHRRPGALINVRYVFHGDAPLSADDVVLLPWGRTGVVLTAQWLDGTQRTALFLRRLEGIPVEIRQLRPEQRQPREVLADHFQAGVRRATTGWAIWILVAAALLLVPSVRVVPLLCALVAGHALALVVSDFARPTMLLPADGLMLVAAIVAARFAMRERGEPGGRGRQGERAATAVKFAPVLVLVGLVDGLAYATTLSGSAATEHAPIAMSAYVAGMDACLLLVAAIVSLVITAIRRMPLARPGVAVGATIIVGSAAVAGLVQTAVVASAGGPVEQATDADRFQLLRSMTAGTAQGGAPPAPRTLTHPFMVFLTVEPFEIRCEILAAGDAIVREMDFALERDDVIQIDEQSVFREQAIARMREAIDVRIDDRERSPNIVRADFLTLSTGGAATRQRPVPEPLGEAIVGMTFVYATPGPPDRLTFAWPELPGDAGTIPVTVTDPGGATGATLEPGAPVVTWTNELVRFVPPEVKAVEVTRPTWGAVSAALMVVAVVVWLVLTRRLRAGAAASIATACTMFAIALHPVVRTSALRGNAMPEAQSAALLERLLTNVYRSFSYRDEELVYDHLAVSVAGEQLTKVYVDQRRSLELERQGGARVRVDRVEVTEIDGVDGEPDGGLAITARWNVSGSVDHFGHTHYRRNRYVAVVRVVPIDGAWKIVGIEMIDEERVL